MDKLEQIDRQRLGMTERWAREHSNDDSTKTACMLVAANGQDASLASNRMISGIKDTPDRREQPAKYKYFAHAEENAIAEAARTGFGTHGATAYINWVPCVPCFRLLVAAGIVRIVGKDNGKLDHEEFKEDFQIVEELSKEIGIDFKVYD